MKFTNKPYCFWALCAILPLLASCSKEDSLEPSGTREDYFTVSADATDPTSVLRREFYEATGSHLLFNDTIRHEQQGTYADGTPYWYTETIDLGYSISTNSGDEYQFEYITDIDEQQEAADFVKDYLFPHINPDKRPYSVLVVKQTLIYDSYYEGWDEESFVNGLRCAAISTGELEDDPEGFAMDMLYDIVYDYLYDHRYSGELDEFFALSKGYYGEYYKECDLPAEMNPQGITQENWYTLGFISKKSSWSSSFPGTIKDLKDYLNAIFYEDEEDFLKTYADYPVVIAKYDILKQLIADLGYNIKGL